MATANSCDVFGLLSATGSSLEVYAYAVWMFKRLGCGLLKIQIAIPRTCALGRVVGKANLSGKNAKMLNPGTKLLAFLGNLGLNA